MLNRGPSAVDRVIVAVKDRIKEALYVPGQRLVEPDLMNLKLAAARCAKRCAGWRRRASSNGRCFAALNIVRMSRRQVKDFLELRELIERYAASCAAARIDAEGAKR